MFGNHVISGIETFTTVEDKQNNIRLLDREQGLARHPTVDAFLFTADPAGINNNKTPTIDIALAVFSVAGQTGVVSHQGIACACQAIKKRGLTYIRASNKGNNWNHKKDINKVVVQKTRQCL